jgi:purine-cytosine permease-like protein
MNRLEAALILFVILFIIIFIGDYFFIKRRYLKRINGKSKKKNKKNNELTEIAYLVGKFKLDKSKLNYNKLLIEISLINAFIISFVCVVVMLIRINVILQLLIGFVLLMGLIYALYELFGRYLVKKGFDKNEY